ncbi:hypothetical protein XPA_009724 [Xanthoria parietina]
MRFPSVSSTYLILAVCLLSWSSLVLSASARLKVGKPTIVLVPGAWHSPIHYKLLTKQLESYGYPVVSERNPSCNSANPTAESAAKDAAFIRSNVIMPQINAGKEVILAMHSYGGLPGAAAGKGLSKKEMTAAGRPGGIIGLIFICALVVKEGDSLLSILPGQVFDKWVVPYANGQLFVDNPKQVFYDDVPSPRDQLAVAALRNQSRASLSTPSGPPAWSDAVYDDRRAYFRTLNDRSLPAVAQQAFLDNSAVRWSINNFPSSHSPFLSHPAELALWMAQEAGRFTGKRHRNRLVS